MSVMIVSGNSLGKLYRGLMKAWITSNKRPCFNPISIINPDAQQRGPRYWPDKDVARFVEECAKWNAMAYRLRYEDGHPEVKDIKPEPFSTKAPEEASWGQMLKTIHCLHYNSDITDYLREEDCAGEYKAEVDAWRPWLDKLERLCDALAVAIAEDTEDYQKAEWG